jgi:protein-S-isoprenylcysteine O-methyltransferase Ste14
MKMGQTDRAPRIAETPRGSVANAEQDTAGVLVPPPILYITALAIGFLLEALFPSASLPPAVAWPLGGAAAVSGTLVAVAFLVAFRRASTPVDLGKPTMKIVTSGPYRFSRNPGYLSLTLIYSGIAILTSALWAFAPLALTLILVDRAVVRREERYLERRFGEEYTRYKTRVRRWI